MLGGLLLALSTTLIPLSTPPQHVSPLVPAKHFQPITVPFEYFNHHIFVSVTLNGRPGMIFLLDSGTNSNVLSMRTSEALGLKPVSIKQEKGLGLGSGKVHIAAAKDIDARIGSVQVANVMAIVDLDGLEQHFGHREDGILGFPFLQNFVVVLDFDKRELTLLPSRRYTYRGPGDMVYLSRKSDSAAISVLLQATGDVQRRANVEIDTGSDVTLMLFPHYVRGAHMESVFLAKPTHQAYGLGGYFPIQLGVLQSMLMGRTQASHLAIFQLQSDPGNSQRRDCVGMIGTSLLEQFQKIVFDVPAGRIFLELKPVNQLSANRAAGMPLP
ncbi:MAG: retropepsin-like aspartic protease [Acidobacteriaceae bacterium]